MKSKNIKNVVIFVIALILMCSLISCEMNSYIAIGLVRSTRDNYCMTSFYRLDGKLIFTPRYTNNSEGEIHYTAHLEEGEINVYYESLGVKQLLFNAKAGEEIDAHGGYIEKGKQKIIIETVSPAKGKIEIEFE